MRARARSCATQATRILALAVAGGLLSACSSAVEVAPPDNAPEVCGTVAWPSKVAGHDLRPTKPKSALTAAWGDPAVIARCGVPALAPTTEDCIDVSGVGWVAHRLSDGVRFTAYGRDPSIEVLVPSAYAPEPLVLPPLSAAAKALPENGRACR